MKEQTPEEMEIEFRVQRLTGMIPGMSHDRLGSLLDMAFNGVSDNIIQGVLSKIQTENSEVFQKIQDPSVLAFIKNKKVLDILKTFSNSPQVAQETQEKAIKKLSEAEIDAAEDRITKLFYDDMEGEGVEAETVKILDAEFKGLSSNDVGRIKSKIEKDYPDFFEQFGALLSQRFVNVKTHEMVERLKNSEIIDFDAEAEKQFEFVDNLDDIKATMKKFQAETNGAFKQFAEATNKFVKVQEKVQEIMGLTNKGNGEIERRLDEIVYQVSSRDIQWIISKVKEKIPDYIFRSLVINAKAREIVDWLKNPNTKDFNAGSKELLESMKKSNFDFIEYVMKQCTAQITAGKDDELKNNFEKFKESADRWVDRWGKAQKIIAVYKAWSSGIEGSLDLFLNGNPEKKIAAVSSVGIKVIMLEIKDRDPDVFKKLEATLNNRLIKAEAEEAKLYEAAREALEPPAFVKKDSGKVPESVKDVSELGSEGYGKVLGPVKEDVELDSEGYGKVYELEKEIAAGSTEFDKYLKELQLKRIEALSRKIEDNEEYKKWLGENDSEADTSEHETEVEKDAKAERRDEKRSAVTFKTFPMPSMAVEDPKKPEDFKANLNAILSNFEKHPDMDSRAKSDQLLKYKQRLAEARMDIPRKATSDEWKDSFKIIGQAIKEVDEAIEKISSPKIFPGKH